MAKDNLGEVIYTVFAIAVFLAILWIGDPQLVSQIWNYFLQMMLLVVGGAVAITMVFKFVLNVNFN